MYWQQKSQTIDELQNLRVSAKVVLISKDGKILLMRKSNGIPDLPGGKVDKNEDLFDGLKREIKEEIGLKAKKFKFITSWIKIKDGARDRLIIVFEARTKANATAVDIRLSKEHVWAEFVDRNGFDEMGDMPYGYANAVELCFNRYGKRKAKR